MAETIIDIDGMTCQHCVMRVKNAIEGLGDIKDLKVEIGKAKVTYDETKIQKTDIENAIIKSGYRIKN